MFISLITPSYNHAEFIEQTIDSVLAQSGDFQLDYRVLDGGSTDNTVNILQAYGDRLRWTSQPDNGQVDAINRGLQEATGDVVGWLNSDDILLPGALAIVVEAFKSTQACAWVHGDCMVIDRHGREIRRWVSAYKRFFARRYSRERLLARNFISQMTVFWRRELLDRIGYLDPDLPLAFDYEYWLRLSGIGPPVYVNRKLAAFRWYETSKSGANFRAQFEQDEAAARRHGNLGRMARINKKVQNRMTVGIYHSLAATRRVRSRGE